MLPQQIYITETDLQRLDELLAHLPASADRARLEDELARAKVVPSSEIPANVVTMNSRVRFRDVDSGEEREVTLVYPNAANFAEGRVSVLAPVGSALLGLSVGDEIDWPMPGGTTHRLQVVAIPDQPEARGDYEA